MTEKNYNPEQRNAKAMNKQEKMKEQVTRPIKIAEDKKQEVQKDEKKKETGEETKTEEKTKKETKKKQEAKIVKKDEAFVRGVSVPVSTKNSVAICKFIKNKSIEKAIADLEEVLKFRKAIPMKGEIPHRKGKGMMSGRYSTKAVGHFIRMLKTLGANSNMNGLGEPVIVEAVANKASRPYGRFGSVQRKRTHIKIVAREKNKLGEKK